ncbi:hypothetical protein PV328_001242 [Microctonus aethiopoides]|uniref:Uncharacterized protein n=1 Tax=Microctonus aethiopoides TaxID=144406 RepID=A0AA39FWV7_9HYME|nr:hypothetical protein PV328_001242 [Microctonus aethiopoides]
MYDKTISKNLIESMKSAYEALLSIDSDTTNDWLIAIWERISNENVQCLKRLLMTTPDCGIDDNRIQWDDAGTAFNSRIITGIITNLQHIDLLAFLSDYKQRVIDKVKSIFRNNGNICAVV